MKENVMAKNPGITVTGASGRMGQMLIKEVLSCDNAQLVGAVEQVGHPWVGEDLGEASGTSANVGKLCNTSNTGNATCDRFPVENNNAHIQASMTAILYAARSLTIEIEKSVNNSVTVSVVRRANRSKKINGTTINDNVTNR